MQKKEVFIIALVAILILTVLVVNYPSLITKLTGKAISDEPNVQIYRLIETDTEEGMKNVTLGIVSSENILGIKEEISENCFVETLDYNENNKELFDIFEFNPDGREWIIADKDNEINAYIYYSIPSECEVIKGEYYTIRKGITWCNGADINQDGKVDLQDQVILARSWGKNCNQGACLNSRADIDSSGIVDLPDLVALGRNWNKENCEKDVGVLSSAEINTQVLGEFESAALTSGIDMEVVEQAVGSVSTESSGGGGGGSSRSSGIEEVSTIVNVDEQQFSEVSSVIDNAILKISEQKGTGVETRRTSFVIFAVLIVLVIGIIVFLIISFSKKPHRRDENE